MDDRSARVYSAWNFEDNGSMDYFNVGSDDYGEKFPNGSAHFPTEMRSANLNQMISNIFEEYQPCIQHQQMKKSSSISESGYPRNIPDSSSTQYNSPKDIQVLIRQGDHMGINSSIRNVSLQQFRQMIGLQRSSGLTTMYERKSRHQHRLTNAFKQQTNQKQFISPHETMSDGHLTTCQEIRRTGVANTLHISIEKCYEQLNYIRDSYAEIESKIDIQVFQKPSSVTDIPNTNFSSLSTHPSRVDRLIAEYQYEYNRIIRLHDRIQEEFRIQDIEATRQSLDEWFNAIRMVQDRRRQEIAHTSEKDVLQLAESLRILRITTRKIRTVLWYWLYWSTNSMGNKIPLIARYQNENLFDIPESDILMKKTSALFNVNNKENEYNE